MSNYDLDEFQRLAVNQCVDINRRVVPVTGQAGTGKTTIMRVVHKALRDAGYKVVLCAPTGKAAKRISEATALPAMTIHRLLEYPMPGERDPKTGKALITSDPKRTRMNPLVEDVVLADEYAMVNTEVHRNLVAALRPGAVLRVFGDINQLPPIEKVKLNTESESPFQMLLKNFGGIVLETIHRQGEGSGIVGNGRAILAGRIPTRTDDFTMKITDFPQKEIKEFIEENEEMHFDRMDDQIIVPTNKGGLGTVALNIMIQRYYKPNAQAEGLRLPRHTWDSQKLYYVAIGDKVIWTQNNYDLAIFNGETGTVVDISDEEDISIDFGDRVVSIPPEITTINRWGKSVLYDPRKDIDLAYVVTTHKAQGSEYQTVVYILNKSSSFIQSRHNMYTAITRARKRVHLITDKYSLIHSTAHQRTII